MLVSPKEVTVLASVDSATSGDPPVSQPSAQVPATSSSQSQPASYVTSDQFSAMNEKLEQFTRFEALLVEMCSALPSLT